MLITRFLFGDTFHAVERRCSSDNSDLKTAALFYRALARV